MFFRVKRAGSYQYLQIVHSVRQGKKVRQQVLETLGRLDKLKASGQLEALIRSGLRHCEKFALIDAHSAGETQAVTVQRIGPDLGFGGAWEECAIQEVIQHCFKLAATTLTLSGPFISACCIGFLRLAAIEPLN